MSPSVPEPTDLDLDFVQNALRDPSSGGGKGSSRNDILRYIAATSGTPGVLAALMYHGWKPDLSTDCRTILSYLPGSRNWEHSGASSLKALLALGRDTGRVRGYMMSILTPGPDEDWVSRGAHPLPSWMGVGGNMNMTLRLSDWAYALTRLGRANPVPMPGPDARPAWAARMDAWGDAPSPEDVSPESEIPGFQENICPPDGDQLSPLEFLVLAASHTTSLMVNHVGRPLMLALKSGHRFHRPHWTLSDRENRTPFSVAWSVILPWAIDRLVSEENTIAASALWQAWCRDFPEEARLMCASQVNTLAAPRPDRWPDWCAALEADRQAFIQKPQLFLAFSTCFRELLDAQISADRRALSSAATEGSRPAYSTPPADLPASSSRIGAGHAAPNQSDSHILAGPVSLLEKEDVPAVRDLAVLPVPPTPGWFPAVLEELEALPIARRARQNAIALCRDWLLGYRTKTQLDAMMHEPHPNAEPSRDDMYRLLFLRAMSRDQASVVDALCKTGLDFRHAQNCTAGTMNPSCWVSLLQNGWDPNDLHEAIPALAPIRNPPQVPCWTTLLYLHVRQKTSTGVVRSIDRTFWRALLSRVKDINQTDLSDFPHILLKLDRLEESRALNELVRLVLKSGADPRFPCGDPPHPILERITSTWLLKAVREELAERDHAILSASSERSTLAAGKAVRSNQVPAVDDAGPRRGRRL